VEDYWSLPKEDNFVETIHRPMQDGGISLVRFEQIKRFLHISPPEKTSAVPAQLPPGRRRKKNTQPSVYDKLEPLASQVVQSSKAYLMIKFKGRSADTNMVKNKPIKRGHKIFALCWRGYT
jgi:hypothetical protein